MASYFVEVGTAAKVIYSHKIDRKSDAAARRAVRLFVKNMIVPPEWTGTITGCLFHWDHEANAPAALPILKVVR